MGAVLSPVSVRGTALKRFRLSEVPESIRVKAALDHAEEIHRALKERKRIGVRRGVAKTEYFGAVEMASDVVALAEHPSDTVYWISQGAWDEMIAEAHRG